METEKRLRKHLFTALKIIISVVLIYFIFTKISFADVVKTLRAANPWYIFLALIFYAFSKILNSFRLNLYFHEIGVKLTQLSNLKLYLLGMFYNLFLPGGIGGDAYKGYLIQKKYQVGTKKVVAVLLLDRLSGMLLIGIFACLLALFIEVPLFAQLKWLFILAIPLAIGIFWYVNKRFFEYVINIFWGSFAYSAALQGAQLIAVYFIIKALGIQLQQVAYMFIFLISSIVSVLPLTIGGIGSREVTFLYGSKWLELAEDVSIGISMVFFILTAFISFWGIIYHFRKPALETVG